MITADGRRAEPDGLGRCRPRSVPRARRHNRALMGVEHAASGRSLIRSHAPLRRYRHGEGTSPATAGARSSRRREGIIESGRRDALVIVADADGDKVDDGPDSRYPRSDSSIQRSNQIDLLQPEADRPRVASGSRPATCLLTALHRPWASWPRVERARRVHAVAGLQLRGLDPRLRAHRQGRRLHLDSHRGVPSASPATPSSGKEESHPRHPQTSAKRP